MDKEVDDLWYWYLTGEKRDTFPPEYENVFNAYRRVYRLFPGAPRCFECDVPLGGFFNLLLRPWGSRRSSFSSRFCSHCETFARSREAGAEVELSILFADIRNSTPLAENSSPTEYKDLIKRFYKATSKVLIDNNAMVNHLMGDQVSALFVPRFAGHDHAQVAIKAAQELLRATGHEDPAGPWIPVGVGVHTGSAYVGIVGSSEGVSELAVLGSAANLCARLSSQAASGEVLISLAAIDSAKLDVHGLESRKLDLKGMSQPVQVRVSTSTSNR